MWHLSPSTVSGSAACHCLLNDTLCLLNDIQCLLNDIQCWLKRHRA